MAVFTDYYYPEAAIPAPRLNIDLELFNFQSMLLAESAYNEQLINRQSEYILSEAYITESAMDKVKTIIKFLKDLLNKLVDKVKELVGKIKPSNFKVPNNIKNKNKKIEYKNYIQFLSLQDTGISDAYSCINRYTDLKLHSYNLGKTINNITDSGEKINNDTVEYMKEKADKTLNNAMEYLVPITAKKKLTDNVEENIKLVSKLRDFVSTDTIDGSYMIELHKKWKIKSDKIYENITKKMIPSVEKGTADLNKRLTDLGKDFQKIETEFQSSWLQEFTQVQRVLTKFSTIVSNYSVEITSIYNLAQKEYKRILDFYGKEDKDIGVEEGSLKDILNDKDYLHNYENYKDLSKKEIEDEENIEKREKEAKYKKYHRFEEK